MGAVTGVRTLMAGGRAPWIAALVLILAGCLLVGFEARHLTFSADDWAFVLDRRGFSADVFLQPQNEHLSALPVLAFKVLLQVFGANSYVPFMALLLFVHGVACVLLYVLARRRVGPWAALVPAAILVVLGPAWEDLLWAFQVGYIGSVAAGLGMVLCLERRDQRGDVAAGALLVVSLLCSSIGLGMLVLAAVLLMLDRPLVWRRLLVVGVPLVLYAVWYAAYGVQASSAGIVHVPVYVFQALSAALASVTGLAQADALYGQLIAVVAIVLLVFYLVRGGRPQALAWAALAAAAGLWAATRLSHLSSFGAARDAAQSRYQYPGVALVLLAVVSIASGWRPTRQSGALLSAAALAVIVANITMLDQRAGDQRKSSAYTAAEAGAMEVARNVVAPDFTPVNLLNVGFTGGGLSGVSAGPYFSAIDAFGSPADTPQAILRRPEEVREAADLIVANAERLALKPASGLPPRNATCRSAQTGTGLAEATVGPGTLWVRVAPGTPAELQLRRFASAYRFLRQGNPPPAYHLPRLAAGTAMSLNLPQDRSSVPWRVRVVGGRRVRLCFGRSP
jgi:hypothetical protein